MRIDVHAHYWATAYIDAMVEAGRSDLAHAGRQSDDLLQRLDELDALGVERQYFSAIGMNTVVGNAEGSVKAARVINDIYVEARDRFNGRFNGYATLTLPFVDEAIAEAERALDLGLIGVAMPAYINGKPLDHADFEPLWEYLGERGAVVYVHPVGSDSADVSGLADFGLNMFLGSTMQMAMTPLRLAMTGVTTRHPKLNFIFAVAGGTLPYLWERYERNLQRGVAAASAPGGAPGMFAWVAKLGLDPEDPMSLFRKNLFFDTSVQDIPASLGLAKTSYGISQLLLGSDAIFASLTEAVELVQNSPDLTAEDKHQVLDVNAERLFRSVGVLTD